MSRGGDDVAPLLPPGGARLVGQAEGDVPPVVHSHLGEDEGEARQLQDVERQADPDGGLVQQGCQMAKLDPFLSLD